MIEVRVEKILGMGNQNGYPSDISADLTDVGSERKKEMKPEIKFNENQEDVTIRNHVSHEAHSGHSPNSVSRLQTSSQNKPEAAPAPEIASIVKLQPQGSEPSAFQADTGDVLRCHNRFSAGGMLRMISTKLFLTTTYPPFISKS